jgi:MFS family permease
MHKKNYKMGIIMVLYLLGIFMGAVDTGIVSPARTIIQNNLGVKDTTGIWMITIYTLAYAAVIPISGKLADKLGRKYIYIVSVALFGIGSVICGAAAFTGSFAVLLLGRVIQALGGGGIIPIATAEFGTTFPAEKRGMALGLVGMVFGVANIIGSSIGSLIIKIAGNSNWYCCSTSTYLYAYSSL